MVNRDLLKASWDGLLSQFEIDYQVGFDIFSTLVRAYSAQERHYHNLNHIQHLLNLIEQVAEICDRHSVLQFSVWFHDYIYDSQAKDNELQSAIFAEQTLKTLNLPPDLIQSVKQIILSTQKHQPLLDSIDNLIFLDIDLAILGSSVPHYQQYAQAIRREYAWLSDHQYQQGRKEILTQFLTRERIYYTEYFHQQLESAARANISAEINMYSTLDVN